ncbi:protease [Falsiroseomonas bella]|uniref:Protease n=1 Tax=Falsiroseomonas bella TaxID=2184016 RepID=A0A317FGC2_9PROT|nr:trypsin-like peptidase domain-containing protein [Falsiroseomonas bella]PWS38134.1 protease [Falsiroseomonas bella]
MLIRAALAVLLLALPAAAQDTRRPPPGLLMPGVGPDDPRRPVNRRLQPFESLGRVQTELGGRCTGALVAPDRVLTAAHCLIAPRTNRPVQPRSVHFLLGYERGEWTAQARVASFVIGDGYDPQRGEAGADWALLTLDRRLGPPHRPLPLLRQVPAPRTPAMLAGYQQDRPEVLLADSQCRILGLNRPRGGLPTLVHDCAGTRGSSGAPLLVQLPGGGWGVAGVAAAVSADMALGFAVPAAVVGEVE